MFLKILSKSIFIFLTNWIWPMIPRALEAYNCTWPNCDTALLYRPSFYIGIIHQRFKRYFTSILQCVEGNKKWWSWTKSFNLTMKATKNGDPELNHSISYFTLNDFYWTEYWAQHHSKCFTWNGFYLIGSNIGSTTYQVFYLKWIYWTVVTFLSGLFLHAPP